MQMLGRRSPSPPRRSSRASSAVCRTSALRRGQRVRAARPDRHDAVVGLDHVARAREQERGIRGPPRPATPRAGAARGRCASPSPARPPRARGCRGYSSSLASNRAKQREGVGRGAGEPGQHLLVVQAADLPRGCFTTVWPNVTWPSPAITVDRRAEQPEWSWSETSRGLFSESIKLKPAPGRISVWSVPKAGRHCPAEGTHNGAQTGVEWRKPPAPSSRSWGVADSLLLLLP